MRRADFTATIKRIDFVNPSKIGSGKQTIKLTLRDIELTNENLIELTSFKPNELLMVVLEPQQINLFDVKPTPEELSVVNGQEEFIELEENQPDPPPDTVLKTFRL